MSLPFQRFFPAVAAFSLAACGGGATVGSGGAPPAASSPGVASTATPVTGTTASPGAPTPVPSPGSTASATATPTAVPLQSGSDQPVGATTSDQTYGLPCSPEFTTTGGGYASCNVKWIEHINLNGGESIGATYVAATHTYYVTNFESGFYSFDTTNPLAPTLDQDLSIDLSAVTSGALISTVENEETAVNANVAIVSRTPLLDAAIIDVSNPKSMKIVSTVLNADGHTMACLDDCLYAYSAYQPGGTAGHILDLTNPAAATLAGSWTPVVGNAMTHNLTEVHPGLVATASQPNSFLDTTDPLNPKLLFSLPTTAPEAEPIDMGPAQAGHMGHSVIWPRQGADKFFLGQSEGIYVGLCGTYPADGRTLYGYDTTGWQSTHTFGLTGAYTLVNGTNDQGAAGGLEAVDSHGSPSTAVVGAPEGCSAHWFDINPDFNNGGLVAMSSFAFGVRLLNVAANGQIQQIGWFVPSGLADTVGVRWITDRIAYLIDFETGGIDVIEYTGPLPSSGPLSLSTHPVPSQKRR